MKKTKKTVRKVAIVLRMAGAAGRDILSGIFAYTRANARWSLRLFQMPEEFTPDAFRQLVEENFDGIIASEAGSPETARSLCASNIPVSFIGDPGPLLGERRGNIAYVRNDDIYIGASGARHLLSLGKRLSYAFVPTVSSQYWSNLRLQGFREELAKKGETCNIFCGNSPSGSKNDLVALEKWLCALPKPCAVMAAWDTRALQILQVCQKAKLRVPLQVSVIGVDNDEILCESAEPPLTSIAPNHEALGFAAARELANLLQCRDNKNTGRAFLVKGSRIVERESTASATPAANLVRRAEEFIRKNAAKGIRASDVHAHLGCSRRLADLRFRQFCGETTNEMILRFRLEEIKKLLATTSRSIKSISFACGYKDPTWLKVLFKRHFNVSMREWRKQNRS